MQPYPSVSSYKALPMPIKLIVGLRNPGAEYAQTRHNAGQWFVEAFVRQYHGSFKIDKKMQGELAQADSSSFSCKALLPLSFMNHSGLSVRAVSQFYRIEPHEILVAHDELDLPPGRIKIKTGGGHGGHNGLRDIISQLGTQDFQRLRIGIGHPGHKDQVVHYVLGKPMPDEKALITSAIDKGIQFIPSALSGDIAQAMCQINNEE